MQKKKIIFESLFSARWLINEKSHTQHTQHQHTQFSMDSELVLVGFVIESHNAHTNTQYRKRWTIFPTTMPNTIVTLETMCYFKLIYGSFMDIGPLMVAIDSIYFYTQKENKIENLFFSSFSILLSAAYSRQPYNSIVNNEHLFQSGWHCHAVCELWIHSIPTFERERFVCFWVPHENWVSSLFLFFPFLFSPSLVLLYCSL